MAKLNRGGKTNMMCYSNCEGTFPFTIDECKLMQNLCSERISELEANIEKINPHIYTNLKMMDAKINGYIKLMDSKNNEENFPHITDLRGNPISKAEGD